MSPSIKFKRLIFNEIFYRKARYNGVRGSIKEYSYPQNPHKTRSTNSFKLAIHKLKKPHSAGLQSRNSPTARPSLNLKQPIF